MKSSHELKAEKKGKERSNNNKEQTHVSAEVTPGYHILNALLKTSSKDKSMDSDESDHSEAEENNYFNLDVNGLTEKGQESSESDWSDDEEENAEIFRRSDLSKSDMQLIQSPLEKHGKVVTPDESNNGEIIFSEAALKKIYDKNTSKKMMKIGKTVGEGRFGVVKIAEAHRDDMTKPPETLAVKIIKNANESTLKEANFYAYAQKKKLEGLLIPFSIAQNDGSENDAQIR